MTPLVSIIIPAYNAAPWIRQTLATALAQTHSPVEIVVVDDGSTDRTLAIAREFTHQGVRVVAQANAGAAAARNHGLRVASGDLVQFLDADDLITADKLSAQVMALEREAPDRVASCQWGRFTTDPAEARFVDEAVFRDFTPVDYLIAHTASARMMHPAAWLVPRAVALRAGPWNESLSLNDDGEYFARVVRASSGIVFARHGASLYRSNLAGSLSRRRDRRALLSVFTATKLIAEHLRSLEDSPRVHRALADYWQRLIYEIYPDALDLCREASAHVRAFGGSRLRPEMGTKERLAAHILGWKLARRLKLGLREAWSRPVRSARA